MRRHELPPSWSPVDLQAVLAEEIEPLVPTICPRDDGICLFYPGRSHSVSGESEAGKTWLALYAVKRELAAGAVVVYLDFEDYAESIVHRLIEMGVTEEELLTRFIYIRPDAPLDTDEAAAALHASVASHDPSLVIIDGVTEAMAAEGWSIVDNNHAADFARMYVTPLVSTGAAVVCLDHVVKRKQSRGRNPIGAAHKLAAISGAAYMIERVEPFAPGRTGRSNVVVAKDRPGAVRRHAQSTKDKQVIGVLQVSSDRDGVTTVTLASGGRDEATATSVSRKMEEILDAMGTGSFRRMGDIKDLVKGGAQTKTDALRQLILEGKVSDSSPYTRQS